MKPSIESLLSALHASWSGNTAFSEIDWTPDNPARGQCVVSSLVIQHYLGGDLRRYGVTGEGIDEKHYCNILPDGTILDATAAQYIEPVTLHVLPINLGSFSSIREKRLAEPETRDRYTLLLDSVERFLATNA